MAPLDRVYMTKYLLVALTLVSSLIGCNTYNVSVNSPGRISQDDRSEALEMYRELNLATVMVQAESGTGSGVVLGKDIVLTAAHVVTRYEVLTDNDGNPKQGPPIIEKSSVFKNMPDKPFLADCKVEFIDLNLDLAVLRMATPWPYTVAKLATADPYLYQKAWAVGHPHGVTDTQVAEGRIQDLWDDGFIRYSAPTTFGNSGGPLFIRVDGKYLVCSIVQRVHVEGLGVAVNHLGLGALPEKVREFMSMVPE